MRSFLFGNMRLSCHWGLVSMVWLLASSAPVSAQVNEWKAEAIVDLGDDVRTFTQTGSTSQNINFTTDSPLADSSTVIDYENVVESDPVNAILKTRSTAKIDLPAFDDVKVLAKAKATFDDVLTVVPVQGWQQGLGIIEFVWSLDGTLSTDTYSPIDSPLTLYTGGGNPNSVWQWAYYVEVEMRAKYIDAAQAEQTVDLYDRQVYFLGFGERFSDAAKNFNEFIDRDDLANVLFDPGVTGTGDQLPIAEDGSVNVMVPAAAGAPVPVTFEMVSGINVRFLNSDFGPLKAEYSSAFDHTANLLGVRLYEADGSPYLGDAIISSRNGATYKLLTVPEAYGPLQLLLGLASLWCGRQRRRSASLAA